MLDLSLEPTDDLARPAFKDEASCRVWLQQLQLTNLHQAHSILRLHLDEFNRYPMRGAERLYALELLRETIVPVQADYAKKLLSKKLPFNADELTIFAAITGLWQSLATGYRRCLQAYLAGDKQLAESGVLLTQRSLRYSGLQLLEYLRHGYEFNPQLWQQLHALFAFAEQRGFQRQTVRDELHSPNHPCTCQAVWVKTLLTCHAHPAELTRAQVQLLDDWLNKWSDGIEIDRQCKVSAEDAPPLAVDLSSSSGLRPAKLVTASADMRFLAMVPLSKLLRVKTILLQQGQSPQQLELGECNSADCGEFLKTLHCYLCESNVDRQAERRTVAQSAQVCFGIEGIYAHIAGKPFKQPKRDAAAERLIQTQIAAFGQVLADSPRQGAGQPGLALESWQIENESLLGAKMLRESAQGERVGVHQLVALKPNDAKAFMLGKVSWVIVTHSGQLRMGVQYFPGIAQPVLLQKKGLKSTLAIAALLLPAVPALKTPASLILPRDFFQPEHLADITDLDDKHQTVKMGFSVAKGIDFERVSFTSG